MEQDGTEVPMQGVPMQAEAPQGFAGEEPYADDLNAVLGQFDARINEAMELLSLMSQNFEQRMQDVEVRVAQIEERGELSRAVAAGHEGAPEEKKESNDVLMALAAMCEDVDLLRRESEATRSDLLTLAERVAAVAAGGAEAPLEGSLGSDSKFIAIVKDVEALQMEVAQTQELLRTTKPDAAVAQFGAELQGFSAELTALRESRAELADALQGDLMQAQARRQADAVDRAAPELAAQDAPGAAGPVVGEFQAQGPSWEPLLQRMEVLEEVVVRLQQDQVPVLEEEVLRLQQQMQLQQQLTAQQQQQQDPFVQQAEAEVLQREQELLQQEQEAERQRLLLLQQQQQQAAPDDDMLSHPQPMDVLRMAGQQASQEANNTGAIPTQKGDLPSEVDEKLAVFDERMKSLIERQVQWEQVQDERLQGMQQQAPGAALAADVELRLADVDDKVERILGHHMQFEQAVEDRLQQLQFQLGQGATAEPASGLPGDLVERLAALDQKVVSVVDRQIQLEQLQEDRLLQASAQQPAGEGVARSAELSPDSDAKVEARLASVDGRLSELILQHQAVDGKFEQLVDRQRQFEEMQEGKLLQMEQRQTQQQRQQQQHSSPGMSPGIQLEMQQMQADTEERLGGIGEKVEQLFDRQRQWEQLHEGLLQEQRGAEGEVPESLQLEVQQLQACIGEQGIRLGTLEERARKQEECHDGEVTRRCMQISELHARMAREVADVSKQIVEHRQPVSASAKGADVGDLSLREVVEKERQERKREVASMHAELMKVVQTECELRVHESAELRRSIDRVFTTSEKMRLALRH